MTLTARLVILLMLVLLAVTAVADYLRLTRDRERLLAQTRRDVRVFAETFALAVSRNVRWGRTTSELREVLQDILSRPGLVAVAIFDPDGRVIAETVAEGTPAPVADEVVRQVLSERRSAARPGGPDGSWTLRQVQPFRWPGGRTGAVEVRQTFQEAEAAFRSEIRERIVWHVVVLVAFLLSVAAVTRWSIARPIRALIRSAESLGRGEPGLRIPTRRRDEIGRLTEAFNRMAEDLDAVRDKLLRQAADRLRLEQDVQQAQKLAAVGRLATELAHEIGTPLNVIAGRAEGLQRLVPADHPGRRHLELIQSQADRIGGIIRTLLDYTRPRRPALGPQALTPVVALAAELLLERYRAKGVRVRLDLPPALAPIRGDGAQLQQVFLNLLVNALDAAPPGTVVRVSVGPEPVLADDGCTRIRRGEAREPALAVHVVDAGPGIPADRLPQIFQPFFSTKRREQGAGLGLPIVEEIVRAHQGALEVASAPGRGTEVTVWLPLAEAPPGPAASPAPAGRNGAGAEPEDAA